VDKRQVFRPTAQGPHPASPSGTKQGGAQHVDTPAAAPIESGPVDDWLDFLADALAEAFLRTLTR